MIASDNLNLHFHCFIYAWRIVTIPYVAHNVRFFPCKSTDSDDSCLVPEIVICFANSLGLQS